jgi:hypothetical protein
LSADAITRNSPNQGFFWNVSDSKAVSTLKSAQSENKKHEQ